MLQQVDRRIELLRNATKLDPEVAEGGAGAEEIELELETTSVPSVARRAQLSIALPRAACGALNAKSHRSPRRAK